MAKTSLYRQELPYVQKLFLIAKYQNHLSSKFGLFSQERREQLLWLSKTSWQEKLNIDPFLPSDERLDKKYDQLVYSWFQQIRDTAKKGLLDLKVICDTLTDSQLKEIFSSLDDEEQKSVDKAQQIAESEVKKLSQEETRLLYQYPPIPREDYKDAAIVFKKVKNALHMPVNTGYGRADLQTIFRKILSEHNSGPQVDLTNWKDRLAVDMISIALSYLGSKDAFKAKFIQDNFLGTAEAVGASYYHPYNSTYSSSII